MERFSEHRPSQAIVNLAAIQQNIALVKERLEPGQVLYATVKANAYGLGAVPVAKAALEAGAQGFAVATVDEGIELRQAGISEAPILVLGLTDPRGIAEILYYKLTVTVSDLDFLKEAYQQLELSKEIYLLEDHQLKIHLALDTGMTRIGLRSKAEVEAFAQGVAAYPWVDWEGAFTHFSTAGGGPQDYIDYQWQRWLDLSSALPDSVQLRHYANSAMGLWHHRQPASSIVRYGIAMYGLDPMDRLPRNLADQVDSPSLGRNDGDDLYPALSLVSEIIYVKEVAKGTKISYGASYESQDQEWIATIPIGYADGWLRSYHDVPVLIEGHACPVVGRINMDQMMVRLPQFYPKGTPVTLIGPDHGAYNHISDIAQQVGTIGYEIMTNISDRIPRVYLS